MSKARYLPGLDGLRALSIVLVIFSHAVLLADGPHQPAWFWHLGELGKLGVRVFFVISGFLITLLLLREEERNGKISLRGFYQRRAFRILPALATFLLVMLVLRRAGLVTFPTAQWIRGALFLGNYATPGGWSIGHLWSLAVEEQFYFLWPVIVVFAQPRWRPRILIAVLIIAPLFRVWEATLAPAWGMASVPPDLGFLSNMDALAIGCLAAVWRDRGTYNDVITKVTRSGLLILVFPAILVINGLATWEIFFLLIGQSLLNLLITLSVIAAVEGRLAGWQPLLDWPPVTWLGRLSYSLYLWQQIFMDHTSKQRFATFPMGLVYALAAAMASYYLIEQPALSLRQRLLKT